MAGIDSIQMYAIFLPLMWNKKQAGCNFHFWGALTPNMAPVLIYPPNKLPKHGVTELVFNVWKKELEIFLVQDSRWEVFMTDGIYGTWEAYVDNPNRITEPAGSDDMARLALRQSELCTFLNLVAQACNGAFHDEIIQYSTSLQWVYAKLCEENIIKEPERHIFNLLDVHYPPGLMAIDFYEHYRNIVIANLRKQGDIIRWQKNRVLEVDEELSPTFEDLILVNVLLLIDTCLPGCVREKYYNLIGQAESLMDYKEDILNEVPFFLSSKEVNPAANYNSNASEINR